MEDAVRVSLLGPLEVRSDGRRAGRRRRQAAVAARPARAGRAARRLRRPPDRGAVGRRATGRTRRTRCRRSSRTCAACSAATSSPARAPATSLRLDPDLIDATRLERLVAAGRGGGGTRRPRRGRRRFRAAVALVAGRRWSTSGDSWFARDAVARLEELVLAAHEGLVDGELAMGRHADVLADLVELVGPLPAARALPGPADHRPLPLGPAGRRAAGVPGRPRATSSTSSASIPGPELQAPRTVGARPRPGARGADRADADRVGRARSCRRRSRRSSAAARSWRPSSTPSPRPG